MFTNQAITLKSKNKLKKCFKCETIKGEDMEIIKTAIFDKWLLKLKDIKATNKILRRISNIEDFGYIGDAHTVGGYVSEIRIDYGAGYRIYFTKKSNEIIILLAGGTKQGQSKDIERAKEIAKEWRKKC